MTRPAAAGPSVIHIRAVPSESFTRRPWKNGLGTTREIVQVPESDPWHWRLSIAESQEAAPFSHFADIDRHLVLLRGAGLQLQFEDGEIVSLANALDSAAFAGEREVTGRPVDGPTSQLNAMWRRDLVSAKVAVTALNGIETIEPDPAGTLVVVVVRGAVTIGPERLALAVDDVAIVTTGEDSGSLTMVGDADIVTAVFRPR